MQKREEESTFHSSCNYIDENQVPIPPSPFKKVEHSLFVTATRSIWITSLRRFLFDNQSDQLHAAIEFR
ncbi:hypothetical protein F0562_032115 [Nyssa sinensis]|uniref:Uncharacterized protein n=1 Tax=Nyssa sinensis TaxID=561372 RepID=A0A5J5AXQ4_9ASTE|nr:hypothetical protein F0562_032115 [Nyssa sinensis]